MPATTTRSSIWTIASRVPISGSGRAARTGLIGRRFITTDITRFCDSVASLYSNVSKPTLDLILFNIQLGRSIGLYGSIGLGVSYAATAYILRRVTPAFGKLAAVEAKLEGDFRGAHSRLITNSEEICASSCCLCSV